MKELTARQQEILDFIARYQEEHGYSPTYQEMADHFGMASKFGIVRHVEALIKKGYLEKSDAAARSFRLLNHQPQPVIEEHPDVVSLPVLGRVAAGSPILAESNVETHMPLPRHMISGNANYYMLRVQGDSMVDAGIFDGDLVVVRSSTQAGNGAIVVALVEGEVTVKRLQIQNGVRYLRAENRNYSDIYPEGEWRIQGVVTSLIRDRVD
jgi:repressor LexA